VSLRKIIDEAKVQKLARASNFFVDFRQLFERKSHLTAESAESLYRDILNSTLSDISETE